MGEEAIEVATFTKVVGADRGTFSRWMGRTDRGPEELIHLLCRFPFTCATRSGLLERFEDAARPTRDESTFQVLSDIAAREGVEREALVRLIGRNEKLLTRAARQRVREIKRGSLRRLLSVLADAEAGPRAVSALRWLRPKDDQRPDCGLLLASADYAKGESERAKGDRLAREAATRRSLDDVVAHAEARIRFVP